MKVIRWFKQQRLLVILLITAFLFRVFYLFDNTIPFSFDHGKDSLAVMDLVINLSPKFIGPWTSIPGLYFGPAWYYMLAPFYLLFGFHPTGGAVAMLLLVLLQIFLVFKYFGKYEAIILTGAPLWFMLSKSAWNPFPMTLVSIGVLILLQQTIAKKVLTARTSFGLGLVASFGFHFSAAFAIFYPVIILLALLVFRVKLRIQQVFAAALGFAIPFFPQLLFELRYNFSQTRAVIGYFQEGEDHAFGFEKVLSVLQTALGEIRLGILPETNYLGPLSGVVVAILVTALIVVGLQQREKTEIRRRAVLAGLFTFLPIFGFFFLHFNVWYVYAIVPAVVILAGSILRSAPKWLQVSYILLLLVSPFIMYVQYFSVEKTALEQSRGFLPIKLEAIERINEIAAGRTYSSYHYVPDIYDFSYQYIYFWRATQGHPLPVEFSYKPGESSYLVQKADLLPNFTVQEGAPELVFFVVEEPENPDFLKQWWDQQQHSEIQETIELSPSVTLYVATP